MCPFSPSTSEHSQRLGFSRVGQAGQAPEAPLFSEAAIEPKPRAASFSGDKATWPLPTRPHRQANAPDPRPPRPVEAPSGAVPSELWVYEQRGAT